ncbi:phenylacetate--CoA ligase family protein [Nitrosospira multiformis]|uniref:phenylacetate--CoA ligase family protein n=1 Tax=Nitrosospira multiformis TaxID=1231 RepID=UPI000943CFC6|nr:AMP-binding protein [Nitrosospira multiformis]
MAGLYTSVISSVFFPLHERLKKHDTVAVRRKMETTQWWDGKRLEEFRLLRLRQFLAEVEAHVPYYRKLFAESGFRAKEIRGIADLARLPLLDKTAIRANIDTLRSEKAKDLARFNTGGSSGEPLVFFIGKERVSHDIAAKWRATRWWGVDIGDPEIVVWGSPIELYAQDRIRALRDRLLRTRLLPAFEMSKQKLDHFLEEIRSMRPKMLFGYPSALSFIARHAWASGQQMDDLGIKVAFVTSERLYDEQRRQISKTFGCPVANGYGGRDAGFIAHECVHGGMHITAEDIIVEIVDQQGASLPCGTAGEIVVTHLATRDFPFIRYRTGDIGILDDRFCACGRGLPLLREIQGRTTDFLVAHDGTVMHGLALIYILRDQPEIREFKIIQERLDFTRILVVPLAGLKPELIQKISARFKARLGERVKIAVEEVAEIPAEKSGKFRYVVSNVRHY